MEKWESKKEELEELKKLADLSPKDLELKKELEQRIEKFKEDIRSGEIKVFLSGKYDRENAILSIYSGAGGQDAEDWAAMLKRMFKRYCQSVGFKVKILHSSFGERGGPKGRVGIKQVSMEIKGEYAFGFLKKESGVHRLVRISPFSPQNLRHTSFALVEVLPELPQIDQKEIEVDPEDLKIETYRASGPGGQYVNRRESAVRITHQPSGIVVSCQSERLQGLNRKKAMSMLYSKLYHRKKEVREKKIEKIKGKTASPEFGNQIRSYITHPYKLVKDLRTGVETNQVEEVLDGNIDQFIEAEIKHQSSSS